MPDNDELQFGQYLGDFLDKYAPETQLRELMASEQDYDQTFWASCAHQLGIQGLPVPESDGGSGASLTTLGVCFEEFGRTLVCAPFLSTLAMAATVLTQVREHECARELLSGIADGTAVIAVAGFEYDASKIALTEQSGLIDGVVEVVLDGAAADVIVVAAHDDQGRLNLYVVRAPFEGVRRDRLVTLDSTRQLARLTFTTAPAELLGTEAGRIVDRTLDTASLLLAAEQLGGAQAVLDTAVDYAKTRHQFGRPIGSFQAVKHRLADMLVLVQSTRSVVYHALQVAQSDPTALPVESALARAMASETFLTCASDNIQIHGGIGFTWEHSAHLYLKRAKSSSLLFGDAVAARRRLAEHLEPLGATS